MLYEAVCAMGEPMAGEIKKRRQVECEETDEEIVI